MKIVHVCRLHLILCTGFTQLPSLKYTYVADRKKLVPNCVHFKRETLRSLNIKCQTSITEP